MTNALMACMGADFYQLPEVIQKAHQGRIRLNGLVCVERGRGFAGWVARRMGLPDSNPRCAMTVEGTHLEDRMIWNRRFGDQLFESIFVKEGDRLIEHTGPLRLTLKPAAQGGRLIYRLERVSWHGLTLPRQLAPRLDAWEGEADGRYHFCVETHLPLIGRVIRYAGSLDLTVLN